MIDDPTFLELEVASKMEILFIALRTVLSILKVSMIKKRFLTVPSTVWRSAISFHCCRRTRRAIFC